MGVIPVSLYIKNFCAISKGIIDFSKYDFCQIKGKKNTDGGDNNGAAKSSIPEAISWAIFGKTGKEIGKDDIIREGTDVCVVKFGFLVDGINHVIKRKRKLGSSEKISFYKVVDGVKTDFVVKGETQDKIVEVLGIDFLSYISSVYFTQDSISRFCSGTNLEITKIIQGIIPQTKAIDEFQKIVNTNFKRLSNEFLSFESEKNALDKMVSDIDVYELEKEKNQINRDINNFANQIQQITMLFNGIENKLKIIKEISILKGNYKNLKSEYLSRVDEYNKYIERCKAKLKTINDEKAIDIDKLKKKYTDLQQIATEAKQQIGIEQATLQSLRDEAAALNSKIRGVKRHLNVDTLQGAKFKDGIKCSVCMMQLDERGYARMVKFGISREEALSNTIKKIKNLEHEVANTNESLDGCAEEMGELKNSIYVAEERKRNTSINVTQIKVELNAFELKLADIEKRFTVDKKLIKREVDGRNKRLEGYKDVDENKYKEISEKMENYNQKIDTLQRLYETTVNKINFYEKNRDEYRKIKDNYVRISNELKICEYWRVNIPKLKVYLTATILPDLNDGIAMGLKALRYNFKVVYKIGKELKSGKVNDEFAIDIVNLTTGYKRNWSNLSGSEKQRIALATFFALNNISKFNFIFLDEVLRGFDSVGRGLAMQLLGNIVENKKIFVIDHLDDIESYFKQNIVVNNINEVAEVEA